MGGGGIDPPPDADHAVRISHGRQPVAFWGDRHCERDSADGEIALPNRLHDIRRRVFCGRLLVRGVAFDNQ